MLRLIALLTLAVVCTGCFQMTEPLIAPAKAKLDKRLLGTWKSAQVKGPVNVTPVSKELEKKGMPAGFVKFSHADDVTYYFSAKVGEDYYLTCVEDKEFKNRLKPRGDQYVVESLSTERVLDLLNNKDVRHKRVFVAMRYAIEGDQLVIWTEPKKNAFDLMAKAGLKHASSIITDSPENVRRFLIKHRNDLFEKKVTYKRVKAKK